MSGEKEKTFSGRCPGDGWPITYTRKVTIIAEQERLGPPSCNCPLTSQCQYETDVETDVLPFVAGDGETKP